MSDMMDKILEESQHLDMDLTLACCLDDKNSLANDHDFSTFQHVFGQNPKLTSTFADISPTLIQHNTSKILPDNLT